MGQQMGETVTLGRPSGSRQVHGRGEVAVCARRVVVFFEILAESANIVANRRYGAGRHRVTVPVLVVCCSFSSDAQALGYAVLHLFATVGTFFFLNDFSQPER